MIKTKTPAEIETIREGGRKLGIILDKLVEISRPGVTLNEIEKQAQILIKESGGTPSFMTVGDYRWATCLCVNDEVVHGIPSERKLRTGDLLTIDIGLIYDSFHTDTAQSFIITEPGYRIPADVENFLQTGKKALEKAIAQAQVVNRVGHISQAIQQVVQPAGYGIVKQLVGHGVGHTLHEEPQIPGFLKTTIDKTPKLEADMTIAIEIIYAQGAGTVMYANDDGWTISTRDGSLSAVFEHTIAVTQSGPLIVTKRPSES
jgi:methionyl aminopeptidase